MVNLDYGSKASTFDKDVDSVLSKIGNMLKEKNEAYGDSALDPIRIFSKSDTIEQLNVRIDDKLSRLARGDNAGEDVEVDLIGYLMLKQIAKSRTQVYER